jgi:acyl-CoA reductase-like NAD-dependent aldehyde dehydrogenase
VRPRYFIQPTVFADVEDNMTICREEIFGTLPPHQPCLPSFARPLKSFFFLFSPIGPVMAIIKFKDVHEVRGWPVYGTAPHC